MQNIDNNFLLLLANQIKFRKHMYLYRRIRWKNQTKDYWLHLQGKIRKFQF
jgi:hypothetical protein